MGGRIIALKWKEQDLFFNHSNLGVEGETDQDEKSEIPTKKKKMGFPLWGGENTCLAPKKNWKKGIHFMELDREPYDMVVESSGPEIAKVVMESPVCSQTGIRITRVVEVSAGVQEWVVTHQIENCSMKERRWGLWGICMVSRPGKVYFPRWKRSPYPLGIKTFDEEGESIDIRNKVVNTMGKLGVIDCDEEKAFKFGVDAQEGWVLAVMEVAGLGLVGYRKQFPVFPDRFYGHGCMAEVYNSASNSYFALGIHGPLVSLMPGEQYELQERQGLFAVLQWPRKEIEVREMVAKSFSGKIRGD